MAIDDLIYQEQADHDELMAALREVVSKANDLFDVYNPSILAEHNESVGAHQDIRNLIAVAASNISNLQNNTAAITTEEITNLLKGKLDPVPDTDGGMWQDDDYTPGVNEYNSEEHPKYNGDTSTVPMQSAQIQEILSAGLDPVVTHADGGIWLDAEFTPNVNEYNVTNPVPGSSSSSEDTGTGE